MLRSYLNLALRNLFKNRLFSAINILGLALSMSLGLFILLLFAIGALTIGSQTMRAAIANPLKSLRSE